MWFYDNYMALNPGKCHYLIINKDINYKSTELDKKTFHAEAKQKLFGIIIDEDLNFQSHEKALIKVAPFMTDFNKKVIFNSLLKSSSIIIPNSQCLNHEMNRLHERGLIALLNDATSTFNNMLSKSNDITIHVKNI